MPTYEHFRDNFIDPVVYMKTKDCNISIKVFGYLKKLANLLKFTFKQDFSNCFVFNDNLLNNINFHLHK